MEAPSRPRNLRAREAHGRVTLLSSTRMSSTPGYLTAVDDYLEKHPVDAFGGPDAASDDFTTVQKAINMR